MILFFRKITLLITVMVSFSACAAVVVGGAAAGAYTYVSGWMEKEYDVGLKKAYKATIEAVSEHDLEIIDKGRDITYAFVNARGANREIRIKLKRISARLTKISVRVGLMGDKKASEIIHRSIEDFL
jgi:hypothetical protein